MIGKLIFHFVLFPAFSFCIWNLTTNNIQVIEQNPQLLVVLFGAYMFALGLDVMVLAKILAEM